MWYTTHPGKFGNHVNVHRPTDRPTVRPHYRHTHVKYFNQQVWQPKCNSRFYLERNRMASRTFRKKKQQRSSVFLDVIFDVYTHVDNRERARASD